MAAPMTAVTAKCLKFAAIYGPAKSHMPSATVMYNQCRGKKSKSMSSTRRQKDHAPGKHRGPKRTDGEFVYKGETLLRQYGLIIYPGENVGIQRNNTLFALRDGIVVVSCEKLSPYPNSPLYERVRNGMTIYKKFWNVYPTPVHAKFKLVSEK